MPASTRRTLWIATLAGLIPAVVLGATIFWPRDAWIDQYGYFVGRDFVNFWFGARLALAGQVAEVYDLAAYAQAMQAAFAPAYRFMNFSYPPHALPLLLPLALLPYGLALALWVAGGLAAFVWAALDRHTLRQDPALAALVLLSPVALLTSSIAQATFLLAALLAGGLRLLPSRPLLAGVLFGLLTVKPHLGLLIPFVLALRGAWRTIAAAGATTLALVLVSVLLLGTQPWLDYWANTVPYQQRVMLEPFGFVWTLMAAPFAWGYKVGLAVPTAMQAHIAAAAAIAGLTLWAVRVSSDWALTTAIVATACVLVSPYALNYDLTIPTAALLAYLASRKQALSLPQLAIVGAFWFMPYVAMGLDAFGVPISAPITVAVLALLLLEVPRAQQAALDRSRPALGAPAAQ